MIDHTGVNVSDFKRAVAFYRAALAPLGYQLLAQFPAEVTGGSDVAGFGVAPKPDFWVSSGTPNTPPRANSTSSTMKRPIQKYQ